MDLFLSATSKGCKESIGFPEAELYAESFEKKFIKKSNILEVRQILKIFDVVISNHVISSRFLPISRHFRTTQKNQNRSIQSRKIGCNWEFFFRLSQKKRFVEPIEKNPYIVIITGQPLSATMSIALFS